MVNISGVDLNLLIVFDALMRERNVTRAGEKIGLSQPAVSNALNRLRHLVGDELFIRGPKGMRPTHRAMDMAGPVRQAMNNIESALSDREFSPLRETRPLRFALSDYATSLFFPALVGILQGEAPGVELISRPLAREDAFDLLDNSETDFVIGPFEDAPPRFGVQHLFDIDYACIVRKGHELAKGKFTLERYLSGRHLVAPMEGRRSYFIQHMLESEGLERDVVVNMTQFHVAPMIVAKTDLIMTLPRRAGESYAKMVDVVVLPSPLPHNTRPMVLMWHAQLGVHPFFDWVREQIAMIAQKL
ncbi:MAG: LysR family transcriptional regulator [Rhodospirillaceae bacterium]|jgi:DNA-binding transcriptional LysR family regulator|nr:LysR family transcriptional regulator [Rhodospirillaceae bacterium]MBT5752322.1 LysR family transcriptional regulator [Rhodospirillaceae bacterium]